MNYPIIKKITDNIESLSKFENDLIESDLDKQKEIMLSYPTVYIHNWNNSDEYELYVGESNNIVQRTKEHFNKKKDKGAWQKNIQNNESELYIIGYEHFNKSFTLDVENRLIHYLTGVEKIKVVHNERGNPQAKYYPSEEMDKVFARIWRKLRKENKDLFPSESVVKDSAIFKASPLHTLTKGQEEAQNLIISRVEECLKKDKKKQLIFVDGEAGTGKTVLNSSTFYKLFCNAKENNENINGCFIVNNPEQKSVYEQIAKKLDITSQNGEVVMRPTRFINKTSKNNPVDFVFVDEAHLLLTESTYYYTTGNNQLEDIIDRAKVTVIMFDENQIIHSDQYWEMKMLEKYRGMAIKQGNHLELTEQLRMNADEKTMEWIDNLTKEGKVTSLKKGDYDIQIFDDPEKMFNQIKKKSEDKDTSLSRVVATFDWEYSGTSVNKNFVDRVYPYWEVCIGEWHKPWNNEIARYYDETKKKEKKAKKGLSWIEQPQTTDEVGSIYTVQGFDLNYAGVILGPSVKYRDGKIFFDSSETKNKRAKRGKTLSDNIKHNFTETLLKHEVRILMTRGVNGLYIYACDDELRKALLNAVEE